MEELQAFVAHVEEDELRALWLVLCTTGARIGEVAAMTWDDLDLDQGTWRVEWTLGKVAGQWQWKVRPKSEASRRTIRLHRLVIEALRDHADVAITLDTYSHVLPAADEDLAATTGDLIIGNG